MRSLVFFVCLSRNNAICDDCVYVCVYIWYSVLSRRRITRVGVKQTRSAPRRVTLVTFPSIFFDLQEDEFAVLRNFFACVVSPGIVNYNELHVLYELWTFVSQFVRFCTHVLVGGSQLCGAI